MFLLCAYTSVFGEDWRTAHLLSTAQTLTERAGEETETEPCFAPPRGFASPRGAEGTDLLPTPLNETDQDERSR